jgi:hypothetical protein
MLVMPWQARIRCRSAQCSPLSPHLSVLFLRTLACQLDFPQGNPWLPLASIHVYNGWTLARLVNERVSGLHN